MHTNLLQQLIAFLNLSPRLTTFNLRKIGWFLNNSRLSYDITAN